jgi:hypothetical protein
MSCADILHHLDRAFPLCYTSFRTNIVKDTVYCMDQPEEGHKEDKLWDTRFKALVRLAPQAFAELVRKYAHLELPGDWRELPYNLKVWK